jgi:hypothetical protein
MALTLTPVSLTDLLNLQAGIQGFTNPAEATAEVALINAVSDSVAAYAARLEVANAGQSEAVMATVSLMEGGAPTAGKLLSPTSPANEFQHLTVTYLPTQQAFAVANGLNITIYNAEVIGLGIGAGGDGTQNNFLKNFGSAALTLSQFETTLTGLTNVSEAAIDAQYQFFVKLYGAAPANLPAGYPNADAAARAVTFGFAVGTDLANPALNPTLIGQLENAKVLNAETINGDVSGAAGYQNNVAIGSQPKAAPLQGGGAPTSLVLTPGADNLTATVAKSTFVALPGANPPLGVTNTLNAGDNLQTTGAATGNSTLQFTAIDSPINPPLATSVTMNGVNAAVITNNATVAAGFSGNITGLTNVAATGNGSPIVLGTAAQGLNTALSQISLQVGEEFTAFMTAAALGGAMDAATVNVTNAVATANLEVNGSTNGYETLTVNSIGTGPNLLTLNTNATSTATIIETGNQNLNLAGTALNIANLHTYNGSAGTGQQLVIFNGNGNVAATGGSANDTFVFDNTGDGPGPTFTSASSVNGGGGTLNELEIAAQAGALLGAGVGPNITNIQVIEHRAGNGFPAETGDLTVDMSRSGSANELDLAGNYGLFQVTVTNLTNTKTVLFEGSNLGSLLLEHTTPATPVDQINFTMAADNETPAGNLVLNSLFVGTSVGQAIAVLNLHSMGTAPDNDINNVTPVGTSVIIDGGTHLTFGSQAGPYVRIGGLIDAITDTGGVTAWINPPNNSAVPSQNFIGGPGNDIVHVLNVAGDRIDFSSGGSDIVNFIPNSPLHGGGAGLNDTTFNFTNVFGWATANDRVDITNNLNFGSVAFTNDGTVGAVGAATILDFTTNAALNASALADNWIKIDTPTPTAGLNVNIALAEAIGVASGAIVVAAAHNYLISFYDLTNSQAVFTTVNSAAAGAGTVITAADAVADTSVVGFVHMSQADYIALTANNLHFV